MGRLLYNIIQILNIEKKKAGRTGGVSHGPISLGKRSEPKFFISFKKQVVSVAFLDFWFAYIFL